MNTRAASFRLDPRGRAALAFRAAVVVYELDYDSDAQVLEFLTQVRDRGAVVLPAAVWIEMVLAAVAVEHGRAFALVDVVVERAVQRGVGRSLRVSVPVKLPGAFELASSALGAANVDQQIHVRGRVICAPTSQRATAPAALPSLAAFTASRAAIYARLHALGVDVAPACQWIDTAEVGPDGSWAAAQGHASIDESAYRAPRLALDAALQLGMLLAAQADMQWPRVGAIAKVELGPVAELAHGVHASPDVRIVSARRSASGGVALDLIDPQCRAVVSLHDVRYRPATELERPLSLEDLTALAAFALPFAVGSRDTDLRSLGASSLDLVRLCAAVEEHYGRSVERGRFFRAPSLRALLAAASPDRAACASDPSSSFSAFLDQPRATATHAGNTAPLTQVQHALWAISQEASGVPVYNECVCFHVHGPIDVRALRAAILGLIERHGSLRTRIVSADAGFVQQILAADPAQLREHELASSPNAARETLLAEWIAAQAREPFGSDEALFRVRIVRVAPERHALLFCAHHAVCDAFSLRACLTQELTARYAAETSGASLPRAWREAPAQLADVARWETDPARAALLAARAERACQRFSGMPDSLAPRADHARPAVFSHRGARVPVALSASTVSLLARFASAHGATWFATLLTALRVLLYRHTGQRDGAIAVPLANRAEARLAEVVGCLINNGVIRLLVAGELSFAQCVEHASARIAEAIESQDVPYPSLVRVLSPQRTRSQALLAQVAFVYDEWMADALALPGLRIDAQEVATGTTKLDLSLRLVRRRDGLGGFIEYSTDLYERETIEQLARHFEALLHDGVLHPERAIAGLHMATQDELESAMAASFGSIADTRAECPVHEKLSAIAEHHAERVAIEHGGRHLRYAPLVARIAALAARLQADGPLLGQLIGIALPRSIELPVAVFAVLRAGAAFLPLDPSESLSLLLSKLQSGGVTRVITNDALAAALAEHGLGVVIVDDEEHVAFEATAHALAPAPQVAPDALAYAISTSGSTGAPKLVLLDHRGLSNLATAQIDVLGAAPGTRVLQFTSPSFDVFVGELMLALCSGATLVVVSTDALLGAAPLADFVEHERIQIATLTPAVLATLPQRRLPELETLAVAGDECPAELVADWADGRRFFNLYGPTEATVWITFAHCRACESPVPIGRPFPNTQAYVLDADKNPVPAGVVGELYLGGIGVARGYRNHEAQNELRFMPDPFVRAKGARMFRTGDVAKRRADGQLIFLGRTDGQVKVRGFRVELGAIERVLLGCPAVAAAAAFVDKAAHGEERVLGAVVAAASAECDVEMLLRTVRSALPHYMVPSELRVLASLPLRLSGKIDRAALQRAFAAAAPGPARAPLDPRLHAVAQLFRDTIDRHDEAQLPAERAAAVSSTHPDRSFFELGGHSLLVATLLARVQSRFGCDVPLAEFLDEPTVRGLARAIEVQQAAAQRLALTPEDPARPLVGERLAATATISREHILVTGATGFVGAHVLAELAKRTRADLWCLIRADDDRAAARRLRAALKTLRLEARAAPERIVAFAGDIAQPRLGLSEPAFSQLAAGVSRIYHCAAAVNLTADAAALRAANVDGTRELLRLAKVGQGIPFEHVSTLSVVLDSADDPCSRLLEGPANHASFATAYAATKAESETYVEAAIAAGLDARIYRPSFVCGDTRTGVCNAEDLFSRFIRGCLELGMVPDVDFEENLVPVDFVSELIVAASLRVRATQRYYHVTAARATRVSEVITALRATGAPLSTVPWLAWLANVDASSSLAPIAALLRSHDPSAHRWPAVDRSHVAELATASAIAEPVVDQPLLRRYVDTLLSASE